MDSISTPQFSLGEDLTKRKYHHHHHGVSSGTAYTSKGIRLNKHINTTNTELINGRRSFSPTPSGTSATSSTVTEQQQQQQQNTTTTTTRAVEGEEDGEEQQDPEHERQIKEKTAELAQIMYGVHKNMLQNLQLDTDEFSKKAPVALKLEKNSHDDDKEHHLLRQKSTTKRKINMSPGTIQRAERVKFTLGIYYLTMKRMCELKRVNPQDEKQMLYPGVEGVYNPLQVMRNRKLYNKYKQLPQTLDSNFKMITPASEAFSSKTRHHHHLHHQTYRDSSNNNRFIWQVNITELVHDMTFRSQHFHELKDPFGELWFPIEETSSSSAKHKSKRGAFKGIHEKMFEFPTIKIEDEEQEEEEEGNRESHRNARERSRSAHSKRRKRFSRSPAKKLFKNTEKSTVSNNNNNNALTPYDENSFLQVRPQNWRHDTSLSSSSSSPSSYSRSDVSSQSFNNNSSNTHSPLMSAIRNVNIKPYRAPADDEEEENKEEEETEQTKELSGQKLKRKQSVYEDKKEEENDREQLIRHFNSLKKLNALVVLGERQLLNKPIILQNKFQSHNSQKNLFANDLQISLDSFIGDLSNFENKIGKINDITQEYKQHLSNDYANKVDVLLALADRTIGEVNTSLTLETRRLGERLEKMDSNLYSSMSNDGKNDFLINFSYYLLENFIGFVLLIIWIFYKFFKMIRIGIVGLANMVEWVFK